MDFPAGRPQSIWLATAEGREYPPLQGESEVEVAVVGGGIVGLTAALLLKQAGLRVAVIESRRIGRQVTGHTTAKLSAQHGLIYAFLTREFGAEIARRYAAANQWAIGRIRQLAESRGIECNIETKPAYVYTRDARRVETLRREAEAAADAGLQARFVTESGLPFAIEGAVRVEDQAEFHPYRYLVGLAEAVHGDGSGIFERTRALSVRGERLQRVITDRGTVHARDVILATNLPFLDRGGYFARAYPRRHLAVAGRLPGDAPLPGMYLSADDPSRSLRSYREGDSVYLIAVGEKFTPGAADTVSRLRALREFTAQHFGLAEPQFWWGNEDYDSMDRLPFVGTLLPGTRHIYVACGFNAWGLTLGTVAAAILSDAILEVENPWSDLFRSARLGAGTGGLNFVSANTRVARTWIGDHLRRRTQRSVRSLGRGEGALVRHGKETLAAYRDEQGRLHALSPFCTHLRCKLAWNDAEKSWDCPCHGSRFDVDGRVLHGPAVDDLERREVD